jgi:hypothetical protein
VKVAGQYWGVTVMTREDRIEVLSSTTTDLLKQLNELNVLREQVRQAQAAARQSHIYILADAKDEFRLPLNML